MTQPEKGEFHARLDEAEPGVFRATYRGEFNPNVEATEVEKEGPHIFPDSHLGDDPAAVKLWVEQMATSLGYSVVIWDELPPTLR